MNNNNYNQQQQYAMPGQGFGTHPAQQQQYPYAQFPETNDYHRAASQQMPGMPPQQPFQQMPGAPGFADQSQYNPQMPGFSDQRQYHQQQSAYPPHHQTPPQQFQNSMPGVGAPYTQQPGYSAQPPIHHQSQPIYSNHSNGYNINDKLFPLK